MEFEEVIKNRKSIRKFKDNGISDELIYKLIELANLSPSAGNLQARSVIIVKNEEIKKEIAKICYEQDFISKAPVVFVVFANLDESAERYGERGKNLYALQDATIFTSYLQLIATNYGLSSCWVGAFDENALKKLFNIKENLKPIAVLPIGYSAEEKKRPPRKSIKELIIREI